MTSIVRSEEINERVLAGIRTWNPLDLQSDTLATTLWRPADKERQT